MKNLVLLLFISFLYGCDRVAYKDAYENPAPIVIPIDTAKEDTTNPIDTVIGDTTKTDTVVTYKAVTSFLQKVLIEDFTGHTCGNCPFAAKEAKKIEELYGERVITMAIHCGQFAVPVQNPNDVKFKTDFRTPVGTALDIKFGASNAGLPRGIINRKKFTTSPKVSLLNYTEWGTRVNQIVSLPQGNGIGLTINPKFDSVSRSINVYVSTKFERAFTGKIKMTGYMVEDKILNWQKFYPSPGVTENIEFYEHNHTLRGDLNPKNGKFDLNNGAPIGQNETFKIEWQGVLPSVVVSKNAQIIFILSNSETDEVLQVAEAPLSSK